MCRAIAVGLALTLPVVMAPAAPVPTHLMSNAGGEREFEIAAGVKMRFCWVPAGTATLGAPVPERRHPTNETEHEFTTSGFWMGKYEVTQGEWTAVMGENPSAFAATSLNPAARNRVKGLDTTRFPVESVSWNDCQAFLKKVNAFPGRRHRRFVLPHENEWEYACRGGKGNAWSFYLGDTLNEFQANCNSRLPFDGEAQRAYLNRPAVVGSYAKTYPHPWGLCDLHGNVWEWCENIYSGKNRAIRGGGWSSGAELCRAALRGFLVPDGRFDYNGLRVCFRPG